MTKAAETMAKGESAAGWTQATLGDFVATRTRGIVPNKTPDTIFELYSVPSLDTGAPQIVTGGAIGSNKQIVDEGTVLLCKINPRINRAWVVSSHTAHQKIASTEWITFPPNEAFEPKYLAYYLKQDAIRDFLSANASGVGGSLMRVKPATLKDYPFPLAPRGQQERIVAEIEKQFSRLDEAVANLKRVKANLKRYKAAVLKAAVEGRLVETEAELARREGRNYDTGKELLQRILETRRAQRKGKGKYKEPAAPDTTDLPELPEGWVWATLDSLILDGPQNGLYLPKSLYGSGHPILRIDDYQQDWIRPVAELQRVRAKAEDVATYSLRSGDLVINRVNSPSHLGKVAVWAPSAEMPLFESNMMRAALSSAVVPLYIATYLRSVDGRARLTKQAKWAVNQASINQQDVCGTPVPLPPLSEQNRIVEEVDRQMSLIRETEAQIAANMKRAERLRQSIRGRAFTGALYNLRPASSTREASANEVKSNVLTGTH